MGFGSVLDVDHVDQICAIADASQALAADLAVAAAITSSVRDQPVRADAVLIGEVGLNGELRAVGQMNARLHEAAKLGFKAAIVPRRLRRGEPWPKGIEILEARSLREALKLGLIESE